MKNRPLELSWEIIATMKVTGKRKRTWSVG